MSPFTYADEDGPFLGADKDTQEADARSRHGMPGTGGEPTTADLDAAANAHAEAKNPAWLKSIYIPKDTAYTVAPPPRKWLLRDLRADREGVIPAGKLGIMSAVGGGGKTQLLCQWAEAVATATSLLGTLDTGSGGKVLFLLGEEDAAEVDRRLHRTHGLMPKGTTPPPEGFLVTLPLVGVRGKFAMTDKKTGEPSTFCGELRAYVKEEGFSLVILDPLARFASGDVEKDNDLATSFVTACESLIPAGSDTSVVIAHHVSQTGAAQGLDLDVNAIRGVTGLVNAGRWALLLGSLRAKRPDGTSVGLLRLALRKANYSRQMPDLDLMFTDMGGIVLLSDDTKAEHEKVKTADAVKKKVAPQAVKDAVKAVQGETRAKLIAPIALDVATRRPGLASKLFIATVRAGVPGAQESETRVVVAGLVSRGHLRTNGGPNRSTLYSLGDVPYVTSSEAVPPVPPGRGVGVENVGEPALPMDDKVNGVNVEGVVPYVRDP